MSVLSIPSTYGWVMLTAVLLCAQCIIHGFKPMSIRERVFNKAFFEKNYPQIKDADDKKKYHWGYPDNGSGQFADKLAFEQWVELNNAIRPHANYLEQITSTVVMLLVAGLYYPRIACLFGMVYLQGRELYTRGYSAKGPGGRLPGVLSVDIGLVGLLVTSILSCWSVAGGFDSLKSFVIFW